MSVVLVLLPLALLLGLGFVASYLWAVRGGQFEDGETPAVRMLFDEPDMNEGGPPGRYAPSTSPLVLPRALSRQSPDSAPDPD